MYSQHNGRIIYKNILFILLLLYFSLIVLVNFLSPPSYYNSDMYSDIILSEKIWTEKTLFPQNWIFGNQLYVIATPVLSAFFCSFIDNPYLSMAFSSTVMAVVVFISFLWMLKAVVPSLESRLYGLVYFVGIVLFFGDAAIKFRGWQLLFTMCSYYACYAITAFLAFGCYLRSTLKWNSSFCATLLLTCFCSFATGIQSLRQTMIMVIPICTVELFAIIKNKLQKKVLSKKSSFVVCIISLSNISGIITQSRLNINQHEIFGSVNFISPEQIVSSISESFSNILDLFMSYSAKGILFSIIYLFLNILIFIILVIKYFKAQNYTSIALLMLFAVSVGCIWGIDVVSSMSIREIYYFMLYPLLAVLAMCIYSEFNIVLKNFLVFALICLLILNIPRHLVTLMNDITHREDDIGYEICDYLDENNYTTAFGLWDFGDEIAVASKGKIKMQFWRDDFTFKLFGPLRESEIYDDDIDKIIYVFYGKNHLEEGIQKATAINVDLIVQKHYTEKDIYLCTASQNIIQLYANID